MLKGMILLAEEPLLVSLLNKSIFVSARGYRFLHREWEEYLAARHLARTIRFENVEELCRQGSSTRMHILAGEWLSGYDAAEQISCEFAKAVYRKGVELGLERGEPLGQIPLGNFLGVVGHSVRYIQMNTAVEIMAWTERQNCPRLVKYVAIQNVGYRVVEQRTSDGSHSYLSKALVECLERQYPAVPSPGELTIESLTAHIYLSHSRESSEYATPFPVSELQNRNSALVQSALQYVSHQKNNSWVVGVIDETMQRVFLGLLGDICIAPVGTGICLRES
jgi:hypothetical protein